MVAPPVPALLPPYASLVDPVADLRAACLAAVRWLGPHVEVVADTEQGRRVAEALLSAGRETLAGARYSTSGGPSEAEGGPDLLVMANGSACRSEKAPGHSDVRSLAFDAALGQALEEGDLAALARLDTRLGADLLAAGLDSLAGLAARGLTVGEATTDYADDPFGVMYWVVRWQCES